MKKGTSFQFKKFEVHHDRCTMKVGTDAVLLGVWLNPSRAKRILDVGTGSGVIALMLAQRTNKDTYIDALEIEKGDVLQAKENVLKSPWPNKVVVYENSFQEFEPGYHYDLIVSNPPYFNNSLLPSSAHRVRARHTQQLSYDELIIHSMRLLNPLGSMAVILPVQEGNKFKSLALEKGFYINRQLAFFTKRDKPQERWLFELRLNETNLVTEELVLYEEGTRKSSSYISLTKDFYL